MRLDHLLSREPSFVGNNAAWPVGLCWLFSCACMCLLPGLWVVGVGAFWVGYKTFLCCCLVVGGFQAHCRVHVQHRVSVRCLCGGGCLRSQPVTVVLLVWVVCGGLFVICIVVASIFVLYCFLCFV